MNKSHPRGLRNLLALFLTAVITFSVAGCTADGGPGFPPGGYAVDVPALWVGKTQSGETVGGVEETQVWTSQTGKAGYQVDLTSIQSRGAGDAWRAASASAATVATLISGVDPSTADIRFHIAAPIDGPSAGGILTVGLLASLRGIPLLENRTMTGTISPDGTIGPVGGTVAKVKAAVTAGYKTVVVPESNRISRDSSSSSSAQVDLVALGTSLGITVTPVSQLAEAFAVMTGQELIPGSGSQTPLTNASNYSAARRGNITQMLAAAKSLSTDSPAVATQALFAETQAAVDAGNLDLASGLVRESYLAAGRDSAANKITPVIQTSLPDAVKLLSEKITAALTRSQDAVNSTTSLTDLTDSQYASIPELLLEVTTAQATLTALAEALPSIDTEADVLRAAKILADQEAAIDVFFPRDRAVLMTVSGPIDIRSSNPIEFLSDYSSFLIKSGEANMTYLTSVLSTSASYDQNDIASFNTAYPIVTRLLKTTSAITSKVKDLAGELTEAAYALSLYVNSSALVSEAQGLRLFGGGIGEAGSLAENPISTTASITQGLANVEAVARIVDARGWDTSYALAQARAGAAFSLNQLSPTSTTNDLARGLQRLWAANNTVLIMQAAPQ